METSGVCSVCAQLEGPRLSTPGQAGIDAVHHVNAEVPNDNRPEERVVQGSGLVLGQRIAETEEPC